MKYKILNSVLNTVLNWLFKADRVIFNSIINLKRKVSTLIQEQSFHKTWEGGAIDKVKEGEGW